MRSTEASLYVISTHVKQGDAQLRILYKSGVEEGREKST